MEKKSNVSQTIIIVLLAVTIILGGFLVFKLYIEKDDNKPACNCEKCQTTTDDKDNNLSFDVSKIVNKDNTYTYALDKNFEKVPFKYSKTDKGYYFCADSCKDIDGDFSLILGAEVFKGGPDMIANFEFLLTKANVVGTPGVGFGTQGEGYFRITSFGTHEKTKEAIERLKQIL